MSSPGDGDHADSLHVLFRRAKCLNTSDCIPELFRDHKRPTNVAAGTLWIIYIPTAARLPAKS
jgi:hypothetical protein